MDKLRAMQLFVRLADTGSFTTVANELNVTTSMISKEINRLEQDLGTRLLHRSTRGQQLTSIGEGYLRRCRDILMQLDDAESFIHQVQDSPKGKLRINAPMALGITDLALMFAEFMRVYPDIELDIHLGDENVDLVEHGFDLGFRASSQPLDSHYVGKLLTQFTYSVCAAESYLSQHKRIRTVVDLLQHNCFIYSYFRSGNHWPIGEGITIEGTLKVNNTLFMRKIVEAGLGIGFLPDFVARDAIAKGALKEILPRAPRPVLTLYALYPNRRFVQPKLKHCVEFMQNWFGQIVK